MLGSTSHLLPLILSLISLLLVEGAWLPIKDEAVSTKQVQKRPFCNAFTGCGKKRSAIQIQEMEKVSRLDDDDQSDDWIDLSSSEPAVEDLMRQIMSQAKLWEAIKEASREISSSKGRMDRTLTPPALSFSSQ